MTKKNINVRDIAIIVPAYNEAKNIVIVLDDLTRLLSKHQIFVINDASTDDTSKICRAAGYNTIDLPINLGIGGAVQTGITLALKMGFQYAAQFDSDGQHKCDSLSSLVSTMENSQANIVIGSRFLEKNPTYKAPLLRRIGMIVFSNLLYLLAGIKITDTTSGLRLLDHEAMQLFSKKYPNDFPDMPALLLANLKKLKMTEVQVHMLQRHSGESSTGIIKSIIYPIKTTVAALSLFLTEF